ncbi:MAG: hypothetical protein K0R61_777, partial [Microvirga sp.]|nr:hypothetical protein [Microvirga sp.]
MRSVRANLFKGLSLLLSLVAIPRAEAQEL